MSDTIEQPENHKLIPTMGEEMESTVRRLPVIVAIDDDAITRTMIHKAISLQGFVCHTASSGAEGLEVIAREKPDLVLLDLMLGDDDGFHVCKEIRKTWSPQVLPVVVITGLEDFESIEHAYEAGANDYLTKPLHWRHLPYHLRNILRATQAFKDLHHSTDTLRSLIAAHPDLIFFVNPQGEVTQVRNGGTSGQETEIQVLGTLRELLPEALALQVEAKCQEALTQPETLFSLEAPFPHDGEIMDWEARFIASGDGQVLVMARDITERKGYENRIQHMAFHDALTGLRNRHALSTTLDRIFQDLLRMEGLPNARPAALLYMDLDNFKRINDTLGHALGDQLLKVVAARIAETLRPSDMVVRADVQEGDSIARIGGDEFCVVVTNLVSPMDAGKVASRLLEALREPIHLEGHDLVVTPSIGIAMMPQDGRDADTILKNADRAMYVAKEGGRNRFQFFDFAMGLQMRERFMMEAGMRRGLAQGMFHVHFQPQIDPRTGAVQGMEALLRWDDPEMGSISPTKFIPVAEETGMILDLGEFVFRESLKFAQSLQTEGFPPMRVAVNLSSVQMLDPQLVDRIKDSIALTGADPRMLEIEVTESVLIEGSDKALITIQALKELGVTLALDDFGTGYSSLSYLQRFPFDILKIDQSFVRNLMGAPHEKSLVTAIIAMGHSLGLELVAEGVEHLDQTNFLLERGCHKAQGFLYGRPMSPEAFREYLRVPIDGIPGF